MKPLNLFKKAIIGYRWIILLLFVVWGMWSFGLGFLGGWFFTKSGLAKFPVINSSEKILILAPHIDDETIGAGGIILEGLKQGAAIKVVYMTNGDNNTETYFREEKKLDFNPEEFVRMGEQRMLEGNKATTELGLKKENLIFLGYPDHGLAPMLDKFYSKDNPYVAKGTKFNHCPYRGIYKEGRIYAGENVITDLQEIITNFQPTLIVVSHPRDAHPDHRATFQFLKKVLEKQGLTVRTLSYIVHYSRYPSKKGMFADSFLYPPKKLFSQEGWVSFELSEEEVAKKLNAMKQYTSQISNYGSILLSFVRRNEIFEEIM